jgi:Ca2+/Na+ antiporter
MELLLVGVTGAFVLLCCIAGTAFVVMRGNVRARPPHFGKMWLASLGLAFIVCTFWFGLGALVPYWIGALALFGLVWVVLGWLDKRYSKGPRQPETVRTIQHADGSRAVVNETGKGYRRLEAGEPSTRQRVTGWLNERLD